MRELFPIRFTPPAGFSYHENFLTQEDEKRLLGIIQGLDLRPMIFKGFEAKRKVASFGYDYNFENRKLTNGKPIPPAFDSLVSRVADHVSIPKAMFAELLVTEYPVGSVINWHRDAPPFDMIVGISLGSDCIFKTQATR